MPHLVAAVMDPRLQDLLAQWRDGRDAADPVARFAAHAEHLLVIDCDGPRNRYSHYGQAFIEHFGSDLTGRVIDVLPSEILPAERRGMLEFEYTFARRMGLPLWRSYTAVFADDKVETWQRLVLPMAEGRLIVGAYPVVPDVGEPREDTSLLRLVVERVPVVLTNEGKIHDLALSLRAFCDSQRTMAELEVLATRDSLTGVANHRHFHHLASLELDHARRMGRSFSLLALDLDHFKRINDTWGHAAGDETLKVFVAACRQTLREYDILGRIGGEEFAVALPNTNADGARFIAERLRQQVEQAIISPATGEMCQITVSIGIAAYAGGDLLSTESSFPDVPALLVRADKALYRAKEMGRNYVVLASSDAP
ncbi:Response regulator [Candidatus Terasakiella magnetica]|nr:Response regulator [Candidatus Terasakiella magnetica]